MCLRDLAEKKRGEGDDNAKEGETWRAAAARRRQHETWASGTLDDGSTFRVGFPKLRRQWEKVLGDDDGANTKNRPQEGQDTGG